MKRNDDETITLTEAEEADPKGSLFGDTDARAVLRRERYAFESGAPQPPGAAPEVEALSLPSLDSDDPSLRLCALGDTIRRSGGSS